MAGSFTQLGGFIALRQNIRGNWPFARIRIDPGRIRVRCFTRKVGTVEFGPSVEIRRLNSLFWRFTEGEKELIYWDGAGSNEKASAVASALTRSGFTYTELPDSSEEDWGRPVASA